MNWTFEKESLLSSESIKQDPEEGSAHWAKGNGGTLSVKEEAFNAPVVKREVEDSEFWRYGGCAINERSRFEDDVFRENTATSDQERVRIKEELITDFPFVLPDLTVPTETYELSEDEESDTKNKKDDQSPSTRNKNHGLDKKRCPVDGCSEKLSFRRYR